jgi:putative SOS response-associated peptidase YedK
MCGRYALNISGEDLALEFAAGVPNTALTASNWNISPTTPIPFIAADNQAGDVRPSQMARGGSMQELNQLPKSQPLNLHLDLEDV